MEPERFTREEIDATIAAPIEAGRAGQFRAFWTDSHESVNPTAGGEVVIQSMWSPAVTAVRTQAIPRADQPLAEGGRAWASGCRAPWRGAAGARPTSSPTGSHRAGPGRVPDPSLHPKGDPMPSPARPGDPVAAAIATVEARPERSTAPDPEGAAAFRSDDLVAVPTCGRRLDGSRGAAAFDARRYARVKKRPLRTDAAMDRGMGEVRVRATGHLHGAWPGGEALKGLRTIDAFVPRDGPVVETRVRNDGAERQLARASLAEAPL